MKNRIFFIFKMDHIIDLITNSSSELFVIKADQSKQVFVEMINECLKGITSISEFSVEERLVEDERPGDVEWRIEDTLKLFPKEVRQELKEKYLTKPNFYGISFDRDWIYKIENEKGFDIRGKLQTLGMEMIDGDY